MNVHLHSSQKLPCLFLIFLPHINPMKESRSLLSSLANAEMQTMQMIRDANDSVCVLEPTAQPHCHLQTPVRMRNSMAKNFGILSFQASTKPVTQMKLMSFKNDFYHPSPPAVGLHPYLAPLSQVLRSPGSE